MTIHVPFYVNVRVGQQGLDEQEQVQVEDARELNFLNYLGNLCLSVHDMVLRGVWCMVVGVCCLLPIFC